MKFSYRWTPERQRKWALDRLFRYARDVVQPYHPHYRKVFAEHGLNPARWRTYDDFRRVPLTMKQSLTDDPQSFIVQPKFPGIAPLYDTAPISKKKLLAYLWQSLFEIPVYPVLPEHERLLKSRVRRAALREWYPIHFNVSGGTTGNPSPAVYTFYDLHNNVPALTSMVYMCGIDWQDRGLNLFPAAPHLAFFQTVLSGVFLGGSVFHTCGGAVIPTERQVEVASRTGFDYVVAIPSYLTHWLDTAMKIQEAGKLPGEGLAKFRHAVVAAEPMVPAYREKIKSQFAALGAKDVKIIEGYGMTELRGAFYECGEGTGLHLNPEKYFFEILDPETHEPVEEGKPGVITFSHIGWRGSVLLRYYTGDLVNGMVWDRCPNCGLTIPRLVTPMCRAVRDFTKIKGSRVPLLTLQTAVRNSEGVESFQIVIAKENSEDQFSRDCLKVFVALKDGCTEEQVAQSIKKNVKLDCEISPNEIVFETNEKIEERLFKRTGLKADWVIDERQLS